MQYLLTKEEYNYIDKFFYDTIKQHEKILQKLCQEVADHKPIKFWGRDTAEPWGCILTVTSRGRYCDECIVQKNCPYEYKRWSK